MSVFSQSLKIGEKEIKSHIDELGSLPKKLDSWEKELGSLTKEEREILGSLAKEILDSLAKEKIDSVIKKMNLWTRGRCIQIEKKIQKKEEREKLDLLSKEPVLLTKEELDSLEEKLDSLRKNERKKGLDSLMKKRDSWEKKLDSLQKNLKIKINPQTKNIQRGKYVRA